MTPPGSGVELRQQASRGIAWSSLSQVGRHGLQLATLTVVARLLPPADFGLLGMAMVVVGFVAVFRDLGTGAAIVQRAEVDPKLLSSLFFMNLAFGVLTAAVVFAAAPLAARFFGETRVVPVLRVLSATFIVASCGTVQQALLERRLAFATLARVELLATGVGSAVAIAAALLGSGVWSLVHQMLAGAAVGTFALWRVCGWTPTLEVRWSDVRLVSRFSLNLTGFNLVNYFARNADSMLIGRLWGSQALGHYGMAYRVLLYPVQTALGVLGRVMFPLYARMQDDDAGIREAFVAIVRAIALVTFPAMALVAGLAEPGVLAILGEPWRPVIPLLVVFAPVGMMQSVVAVVGSVYQAKGRTDRMLRMGVVASSTAVVSFLVGVQRGPMGVAVAYAAATALMAYPNLRVPLALIGLPVGRVLRELARPTVCAAIVLSTLLATRALLAEGLSASIQLLVLLPAGAATCVVSTLLVNRGQLRATFRAFRA